MRIRHDALRNETIRRTVHQERTSVVRIAEQRLTWFEHVSTSRMGSERLPANTLHRSVNERREQWRQPKKWMDNVKEDMETRNFISNDLTIIQNRIEWRSLVAASSSFKT